ncbi:hypothetical protein, partial [Vibrio parahaemolyticus]|uniref:hypothetical protein n=1 Tax=Vibrio parahaemolyticus TaxID=670 RepID=UPI0015DE929B
ISLDYCNEKGGFSGNNYCNPEGAPDDYFCPDDDNCELEDPDVLPGDGTTDGTGDGTTDGTGDGTTDGTGDGTTDGTGGDNESST